MDPAIRSFQELPDDPAITTHELIDELGAKKILRLRQAIKDAEARNDEPEVLRLEDELRAAEQAARSTENSEAPSAPVPARIDHASHIAELRKAITAAEARRDEPAVLRLEDDLRAVEQEMNEERAKAAHAEEILRLRQAIKDAEARNDEPEVLRLEDELRAVETAGSMPQQEAAEKAAHEENPVVPEVVREPVVSAQTPPAPVTPEAPRKLDRRNDDTTFFVYPESPTQTPESDYSRFAPKAGPEVTPPEPVAEAPQSVPATEVPDITAAQKTISQPEAIGSSAEGFSIEQAGRERFARMAQRFNAAKDSLASGIEAAVGNAILKSQAGAKLVFYAAFATPELIAEAKSKGVAVVDKAVEVSGEAKAIVAEKVHATGSYMEERIAQVLIPIQARYESAAQTMVDLKDHFIAALEIGRQQRQERRERVLAAKAVIASKRQQLSQARVQLGRQTIITS
jgi:hypothetical protein